MHAPSITTLPAELKAMVIDEVGPEETKTLHSTSWVWNSLCEARYAAHFYHTLTVSVDLHGLKRLEAISCDEVCRKRVRRLSLEFPLDGSNTSQNYKEPPSTLSRGPEPRGSPSDIHHDQLWLFLTPMTARDMIVGAIKRLDNCTCLHVKQGNGDVDWDGVTRGGGSSLGSPGYYKEQQQQQFRAQAASIAFAALVACRQIRSFEFEASNHLRYVRNQAASPGLKDQARLLHIRDLSLNFLSSVAIIDGFDEHGYESILEFFPDIRSLQVRFRNCLGSGYITLMDVAALHELEGLCLESICLDVDHWVSLIKRGNFKTLKHLTLTHCYFSGEPGIDGYVALLRALRAHTELRTLRIENNLSYLGLAEYATCDFEFVHRSINETKPADLVATFRQWAADCVPKA